MENYKIYYSAAEVENIDSETLAKMLNDLTNENKRLNNDIEKLNRDIENLKSVCNYRQQELDKATACLDAVCAVLTMREKS